jgi:hypothetical protein
MATIALPADIEAPLTRQARQKGVTLEQLAIEVLLQEVKRRSSEYTVVKRASALQDASPPPPQSGLEGVEAADTDEIFPSRAVTLSILGLESDREKKTSGLTFESGKTQEEVSESVLDEIAAEFRRTLEFLLVRLAKQNRLEGVEEVKISDGLELEPAVAREILLTLPIARRADSVLMALHNELVQVLRSRPLAGPWGAYELTDKGIILRIRKEK